MAAGDAPAPVDDVVGQAMRGLFGRDSLYTVAWALQMVGAAALTPLITRLLGSREFGAVAAATAVMQVLFVIGGFGLSTSLQWRHERPGGAEEAPRLLTLGIVLAGVVTVLVDATGPLWSRYLGFEGYGGAVRLAVYWAGASAVTHACLALLRSRDRLLAFSTVSLMQSVGAAAASVVLVELVARTATVFVLGQLVLQIVAVALGLWFAPPARLRRRDRDLARRALAYGLPLVPAVLSTFVLAAADRLVVQAEVGVTAVGRYQVAYNVGDVPMVLLGVLATTWMPRIFALDVPAERGAVIAASRDALYRLLVPVIVGLSVGSPLVLRVWAPPEYRPDGLLVVTALVVVTAVPYTAVLALTRALLAEARTRTIAVTTAFAAAANIVLNLALVPSYALAGAAAATLLAYTAQHGVLLRIGAGSGVPGTSARRRAELAGAAALALASTAAPTTPGFLVVRAAVVVVSVTWFGWVLVQVSSGRSVAAPWAAADDRPAGRRPSLSRAGDGPVDGSPTTRAEGGARPPSGRSAAEVAAIVMAHADPVHLERLVGALEDVPVFLHCDARAPRDVARQMAQGLPDRVVLCDRLATNRASWSLVEAELAALRRVLRTSGARHVALLSGADYPLVPMQELRDVLRDWDGHSLFRNVPLPFDLWNTRVHRDGGLWRLRHRFVTRRGRAVMWRDVPLHWPLPRRLPPEVELRAASHWKIYARRHAQMLLHAVDTRPDLVRFWRSTHMPEESFAASVLGSRAIFGSEAMPTCLAQPWYILWPRSGSHPRWLRSDDFHRLRAARCAPPVDPRVALDVPGQHTLRHGKLFARKFSTTVDTDVLDLVDDELRR